MNVDPVKRAIPLYTKQLYFSTNFLSYHLILLGSSGSNTANNDFESFHQQLTYDKRLYKECPFIGFYLSLCEERIETELGLWQTFRTHLLNTSSSSSSSSSSTSTELTTAFIDACWRKTLTHVNKTHGLGLSFPPQRLMLFKWCERALDLPNDHPLLILYWQKFFHIYLEKDELYSSSASSSSSNTLIGTSKSNNKNGMFPRVFKI